MKKLILVLAFPLVAVADNWPAWRGPGNMGVANEVKAPAELSLERGWKVKLEGRACSTPVVWDGRVFVTGVLGKNDGVQAFDLATGNELWRKSFGEARLGRTQRIGSSANSSPLTDGERLYVYFKSGVLAALTLDGEVKWSCNFNEKFVEDKILWDKGTSPIFAGGNLVIAVMQQAGKSFLVSLDKKTGEKVWMTPREFETIGENGDSYTTPFVMEIDGVETIVTWGADHLTGHDAKSGEQLWFCGGFNPTNHKVYRTIASAVGTEGVAVVPFGREEFVAGIKLGGKGDITETAWLWKKKGFGTDTCSPAAAPIGKVLILCGSGRERGTLTLLDAKSGEIHWQADLPKSVHKFCASPVVAGGNLYIAREDGAVFSARAAGRHGPANLKEIALGEGIIASPVVVDGKLLIRGDEHLYCFQ